MSRLQLFVVVLTVGLNALDGFDVMSISFASPGIATEWGISRTALGIVLSMELIGMGLGSIFLGGLADRYGRRPAILGCVIAMAVGMYMASTVRTVNALCVWRVVTGLGIGGMLAAINAMVAEFSNTRRQHLCVSIMAIGYPVGAVLGGLVVARLLRTHDWRSVFQLGAIMTGVFIPLVLFFLPESVHWLARKQPDGALERINRTLARMGHAGVSGLPQIAAAVRQRSQADLFSPALIRTTIIVTLAYAFHMLPFYFMLKWVPKIVVDLGFAASAAADVLVWANVGGALGGLSLGLLTLRFGLKPLTILVLLLTTLMVAVFGRTPPNLQQLALICAGAGFCINAAIVGMYALFAQAFPTHVRASGTGFAIGCARGSAAATPIIAGLLFDMGYGRPSVAMIMSLGAIVSAAVLLALRMPAEASQPDSPRP
ncbi:MAG: MFS transporter [Gammaproteobacteria bacterium]|nr:MFS transporter [Gammaproteobacteria bacterium]